MSCTRRLTHWLVIIIVIGTLTPSFGQEVDRGRPLKSSTGAVLRSMVVPGWGQVYTANYWKAGAFALTEGSLIASIWWNQNRVQEYIDARDFELEKFHRNQRNKLIWWLAGVTLMSMGDAYVDAHLYGLDWSPEITLNDRDLGGRMTVAVRF